MNTTIPSLIELVSPYQHFPKAIQQALLLSETHPCLTTVMTRGCLAVLKAMVTLVDKANGCSPFRILPHLLAPKAGVSEKTVQRAVGTLRHTGLIKLVGDGRDDTGAFVARTYHFTENLAQLLGLPIGKTRRRQRTKMADDVYIDLSLKRDQPEISDKSDGNSKAEAKPIELPPELAGLPAELSIKDTGIAKLRGMACSAGYDLAHVVACARKYMLKKCVNNRFEYLARMISKPNEDYAGRAGQEARIAAETEKAAQAKATAQKCVGKRFVAPDGLVYRFISECIAEILCGGRIVRNLAGPQVAELHTMVASGELIEQTGPAAAALPAGPAAPIATSPAPTQPGNARAALANLKAMTNSKAPAAIAGSRFSWLDTKTDSQ